MKRFLVTLICSILIFALPVSASALDPVYLTTNYENLIYDLQNHCYIDLGSGSILDMSFVPDDIEHVGYYNPDAAPSSPEDPVINIPVEDSDCVLNGVNYSSIVEAFDVLSTMSGSQEISLRRDCYTTSALVVPVGVHLSLLLNDCSIHGECNYDFINDGDLFIIGSGSICNILGGGLYNRGAGTVTIYNCVSFDSEGYAFVNNKDGSIFIHEDTNIISSCDPYSQQLSSGAGSIIDNTIPELDSEAPEEAPGALMFLSSPSPESDPDLSGSDDDLDSYLDTGVSFLSRIAHLLITPPYLYICVFVLLCLIAILIKCKFF